MLLVLSGAEAVAADGEVLIDEGDSSVVCTTVGFVVVAGEGTCVVVAVVGKG